MLSIQHDFDKIAQQYDSSRFKKDINLFMRKAINDTAKLMRDPVKENLKNVYKVKTAPINKSLSIRKATTQNLSAYLVSRGPRLNVLDFSARQTKKGVNAVIKLDSSKHEFLHYFIATMKSGHRGVFKRSSTKMMINKPKRQAIEEVDTLSIPHGLNTNRIQQANIKAMTDILTEQIHDIGSIIYKKKVKKLYG